MSQFPPEALRTVPEQRDQVPATYHYGPARRPPSDFSAQLRDWVDVLVRGRWLILATTAAVALPVLVYAMLAPDVYQATARVYVESESNGTLDAVMPSAGGFARGRGIADELYIMQYAEDVAEEAARSVIEAGETAGGAALPILQTASGETAPLAVVARRIQNGYVSVRQEGGGNISAVQVAVQSEVPAEAAIVANAYADAYVTRARNSSRSSVSASREFLEAQADSVAAELSQREENARDYMEREGAVRLDEEASNLVSQVAALEAERDQARIEVGMEQSRIAELRSQIASLEPNLATRMGSRADRELARAEAQLTTARAQLEEIYLRNPSLREADQVDASVATLRSRIETLERQVERQSAQVVRESIAAGGVDASSGGLPRLAALRDRLAEAEVTVQGLRSRISTLNGRIGSYQSDLSRVPGQTVELARLIRERQSTERLALGLDQRLQEARVAESSELGYAEVIRRADIPGGPVAPNRTRLGLLGLLLGLGLGVALALGRSQLDQAIRRPGQLRDLGHPVMGVIPDITDLIRDDFGGADTIHVDGRDLDTRLVALLAPMSTAAESFRGVRTSVQFSRPDAVVKTLLVTSASPGEGKSTIAANIAVVMAQSGRRTLLIDADLRRPRVHRVFGVPRSPGLSERLIGGPRAGRSTPATTIGDDLDVLPAGALVPNPAEHLGSKALRDLLDGLKDEYDVVVIDAPPVMAATDPVLLSTQVDATLLVTAAGETKEFELEYAQDEITSVGGRLIGVVLNRFDVSREYGYRYQYAYRYGKKYSYGHESE